MNEPKPTAPPSLIEFGRRHLRIGWIGVLVFLTLGMVLEFFLGFRSGFYLDVDNETRRLMWRLAHAHGTLLSVLNIAFGATCAASAGWSMRGAKWTSPCLIAATLLLPGGFFLGGFALLGTDPGVGVFLSPVGSLFLLIAIALVVRDVCGKTEPSLEESGRASRSPT